MTANQLYQFHSSSLWSFTLAEVLGLLEGALESGTMTLPRPCTSLSSSSNDCVDGDAESGESGESEAAKGLDETDAKLADAGPGEASAEKNDCETSERRTDARFWLFVKLSRHSETGLHGERNENIRVTLL